MRRRITEVIVVICLVNLVILAAIASILVNPLWIKMVLIVVAVEHIYVCCRHIEQCLDKKA
jgi:uncharacterized membrane protein YdbT with pleckstrin-like domain